eukprot:308553-Pyramimonas_sp.AAC.2
MAVVSAPRKSSAFHFNFFKYSSARAPLTTPAPPGFDKRGGSPLRRMSARVAAPPASTNGVVSNRVVGESAFSTRETSARVTTFPKSWYFFTRSSLVLSMSLRDPTNSIKSGRASGIGCPVGPG